MGAFSIFCDCVGQPKKQTTKHEMQQIFTFNLYVVVKQMHYACDGPYSPLSTVSLISLSLLVHNCGAGGSVSSCIIVSLRCASA